MARRSNRPKLSTRLQGRVGKRTRIKRSKATGQRIGGGTLITQKTVNAVKGDEFGNLIIAANNTVRIKLAINDAIVRALEEIGLVAEGAAKRLCPVDTGRLRNSITHALMGNDTVIIGTNVEYGLFVHEKTHNRAGTPFLTQAVTNNAKRFESILRKHMQNG